VPEPANTAKVTEAGSRRVTRRRKIAAASWRAPSNGLIHAFLDLDVTAAEEWWRDYPRVSATHVVGCAIAQAVAACPDARGRVVGGRILTRETVDVAFVVDRAGRDLTSTCVRDADTLDPAALAVALGERARDVRGGRDRELGKASHVAARFPSGIRRLFLWASGVWTGGLGWPLRPFGLEPHPFGSVLVSSVGMFGLDTGLAPILPYARHAGTAVVGEVTWQARVVHGEIVPRRMLRLGVTLDHRLVDGAQAALMARIVREIAERPWETWGGGVPASFVLADEPDPLEII
jgi:hypothetical protein